MKPRIHPLPIVVSLTGLALASANAATFTWARGVAAGGSGAFSWNNSTLNGDVTNGNNWNSTPSAFPNAVGDIANIANAAGGNNQTINLDQNITIGAISNIGSTNGTGAKTIAAGGAFTLTFDNGASNASITKLNTTNSNASTISAPIAIAGNGVLALANSSTNTLTLSGGITSALTSGTQTLSSTAGNNNINGAIGNGSSGGTMALQVTGGNLTLNAANTYTGSTTITAGTLTLGGTAGAISTSSTITNNGAFTINRTNTVVQGTDFSGSDISGSGALNATGTGLHLTLNTSNSYSGVTTIGFNQNNSALRATASGALGSGTIQMDSAGNNSTARLELSGGTTLSNSVIQFAARNNTSVGIQNISGNNTLSGALNLQSGGANHIVQSDSGALTLSGDVANASGTGTRTLTVTGSGDGLISGVISNGTGTTALTKSGGGTWTVSNTGHTYTGATSVTAGKLIVNGNISTSVSTTISGTGTLGGSGAVGNLVAQSGGTVAPGNSIESLGAGNVSFESGSTFAYELNTLNLNGDLLDSTGTLDLTAGANLTLTELASATRAIGDKLTLISYTGAWNNGIFNYLSNPLADDSLILLGNNTWLFNYNDTSGGSNFTSDQSGATGFVTMTVVPEPGSILLGSIGMLALLRRRR